MSKRKPRVSEQLKRAIGTCGCSRYRIWKETGVSQAALSRFMSGERSLTLDTVDILADFLGLELVSKRKGRT
ncbi:MAG: helix-turn-helix transcriptional regulator [Planctomycetes bacterium]|nr:helix-turn-helix transcriptional regulator [Planctomycetota bacterium]